MTERQVTVDDVRLSVADADAGQRPLLLVHGFTGPRRTSRPGSTR
jgi:pimeloyl-ACP methyl ester carboxylesterase